MMSEPQRSVVDEVLENAGETIRWEDGLINASNLDELISHLDRDSDVILQANCLQIVADLACSAEALNLLEEKGVPKTLIRLLERDDALIAPHALKFFYRVRTSDLEKKYPQVLDKLFEFCSSENKQFLDYAIDLIGVIGRRGLEARKMLDRNTKFINLCLPKLGETITTSDGLLKSRTLKCIYDLVDIEESAMCDEAVTLASRFYHGTLSGEHEMTKRLLALCRVPFMEIRISAMTVVAAVAKQLWAQRELSEHPTFLKWLIDRSTEACKEGKEAKFEILRALVKSRTTPRFFRGEDFMKMRADFKNGPFHKGIPEEMLMENQQA